MYYIYVLKDLCGNIKYVGQTQQIKVRKKSHERTKPPHTFELIEEIEIPTKAKELEIYYIEKYNTYKGGWNKSPGGEGFENYNRKGIGGAKGGNIPWNKGIQKCFSEETVEKMKKTRKGRVFSRKLDDVQIKEIRNLYEQKPFIEGVGEIMKNGKKMSYVQAFCKTYCDRYNITLQGMKRIILKECWKNV